jgi:hypothetical protein
VGADREGEVDHEGRRGGDAHRCDEQADDQAGGARQEQRREQVELSFRHAHAGVRRDDLRAVAQLAERGEHEQGDERQRDHGGGDGHEVPP